MRVREKYKRSDLENALQRMETEPAHGQFRWWTQSDGALGWLWGLDNRVSIHYSDSDTSALPEILSSLPSIPRELVDASRADRPLAEWLFILSIQASKCSGDFLIRLVDPWRNHDEWLRRTRRAEQLLRLVAEDGELFAQMLAEAEAELKWGPVNTPEYHKGLTSRRRSSHTHLSRSFAELLDNRGGIRTDYRIKRGPHFACLLSTALKLSDAWIDALSKDSPYIADWRRRRRTAQGYHERSRRPISMRRLALYLWLRLVVGRGWKRAQATKSLNEFLRVRRCGFRVPPKDSPRPIRPPRLADSVVIWPAAIRKGIPPAGPPAADILERILYSELGAVLKAKH